MALLFAFASFAVCNARAEEKWERPGTKEQAAVDQANKELDRVYAELMAKVDDPKTRTGDVGVKSEKISLRDAQRAWIKWRDAEALFIARLGGAVGGSALRVDVAEAQLKLINDRIAVLKAYLAQAPRE
ncbi:MAG TPA: lysozyme inhibitor LprI family protein [Chthoniobacterales bacterium]|nr:lysozyme inhibitor LprI family protein [Chthoniobacterales bacterium]